MGSKANLAASGLWSRMGMSANRGGRRVEHRDGSNIDRVRLE